MAADLAKLRTAFVGRVSKEIVNQLLDDLLDDGVMNSGEKEAIIEENKSTADKARKLIDIVRKKGDKASNRLILHFQKRDHSLYEDLCQACGLTVRPAAQDTPKQQKSMEPQEPPEQHDGAATLIKISENFWIANKDDINIYPVNGKSAKNRLALLITNITFRNERHNRHGAEKDEENMENLLSALEYEVVKYTNLTAKEMDDALVHFSKHPKLSETDSVFVVIMSHGKRGAVLGVNFKPSYSHDEEPDELPLDNIYRHLNAENCPALINKPKVIIIQACRGAEKGLVIVSDNVETDDFAEEGVEEDGVRFVHKEKDFIPLLSCTPDTVSYRETTRGSFLIQFVVEIFRKHAHEFDIEELFRRVMRQFEENKAIPNRLKQMPTKDRCTLTRRFYLFPGLKDILFS